MSIPPPPFPFDVPLDALRRRASAKWRVFDDDVLPLWVAEMDAHPSDEVLAAVAHAMTTGDTGYAAASPYIDALRGFAEDRWSWRIAPEQALLVPDVMQGAMEALGTVTGPGDAVVVTPPVYPPFFGFLHHHRRRIVEAPLDGDLRLDLDGLERAFADATAEGPAALLLCNPQNPTGTVHTREELAAVAELAARFAVQVVADEIHAPLVLPGADFVPYLTVPGGDRGIALQSASKGWNLAGLKAAIAVFGDEVADRRAQIPEVVTHGASHLGTIAHTAAFRDARGWLDAAIAMIVDNRTRFAEALAAQVPDARYRPGAATYLAWVDLREAGFGDDPATLLREKARLAVNPGLDFGTGGTGHVRVNLATAPAIVDDAVARIASIQL